MAPPDNHRIGALVAFQVVVLIVGLAVRSAVLDSDTTWMAHVVINMVMFAIVEAQISLLANWAVLGPRAWLTRCLFALFGVCLVYLALSFPSAREPSQFRVQIEMTRLLLMLGLVMVPAGLVRWRTRLVEGVAPATGTFPRITMLDVLVLVTIFAGYLAVLRTLPWKLTFAGAGSSTTFLVKSSPTALPLTILPLSIVVLSNLRRAWKWIFSATILLAGIALLIALRRYDSMTLGPPQFADIVPSERWDVFYLTVDIAAVVVFWSTALTNLMVIRRAGWHFVRRDAALALDDNQESPRIEAG